MSGWRRATRVYWAGRATLLTGPEQIDVYDRAFRAFWEHRRRGRLVEDVEEIVLALDVPDDGDESDEPDTGEDAARRARGHRAMEPGRSAASSAISPSTPPAEFVEARRLMDDLRLRGCQAAVAATDADTPPSRHARRAPHRAARDAHRW